MENRTFHLGWKVYCSPFNEVSRAGTYNIQRSYFLVFHHLTSFSEAIQFRGSGVYSNYLFFFNQMLLDFSEQKIILIVSVDMNFAFKWCCSLAFYYLKRDGL